MPQKPHAIIDGNRYVIDLTLKKDLFRGSQLPIFNNSTFVPFSVQTAINTQFSWAYFRAIGYFHRLFHSFL